MPPQSPAGIPKLVQVRPLFCNGLAAQSPQCNGEYHMQMTCLNQAEHHPAKMVPLPFTISNPSKGFRRSSEVDNGTHLILKGPCKQLSQVRLQGVQALDGEFHVILCLRIHKICQRGRYS